MDAGVLSEATKYGVGIFLGILILLAWFRTVEQDKAAYNRLVEQIATVIQNNSAVMAKVEQVLEASCVSMAKHDARAERIESLVERIDTSVERIEGKIDKAFDVMSDAKAGRAAQAAPRARAGR